MKKKGLHDQMLMMTVLPLIVVGIVIMVVCYNRFSSSMYEEVNSELESMAVSIERSYDSMYPGDYKLVGTEDIKVYKGDRQISSEPEFINNISDMTDMEITLFITDVRFVTTITDSEGNPIEGTLAHTLVKNEVFVKGKEKLYENVIINGVKYYTYYMPLRNSDGKIVGMIGIGKPMSEVKGFVIKSVMPIMLVVLFFVVILAAITFSYTTKLVRNITSINDGLKRITAADFSKEIDGDVLKRDDELGNIARSVNTMQNELRVRIEQDSLTGIYNRGTGQKLIRNVVNDAIMYNNKFCVALGDIDFFKKVNDNYGHEGGDIILKGVASILKKHMRKQGYVCRWGGEEFLLVFNDRSVEEAYQIMMNIEDEMRQTIYEYLDFKIGVTMTFGLVEGDTEESVELLIKKADELLYEGKQGGRNRVVVEKREQE